MKTNVTTNGNFRAELEQSLERFSQLNRNAERILIALLLDKSGSMGYSTGKKPIDLLNEMTRQLKDSILNSSALRPYRNSIQMAVISFSSNTELHNSFLPVESITMPTLLADGTTYMGDALECAQNLIRTMKQSMRGAPCRSLILLATDGECSGANLPELEQFLKTKDASITVLPIALGKDANKKQLAHISTAKEHAILSMDRMTPDAFDSLATVLCASIHGFSSKNSLFAPLDLSILNFDPAKGVDIYFSKEVL